MSIDRKELYELDGIAIHLYEDGSTDVEDEDENTISLEPEGFDALARLVAELLPKVRQRGLGKKPTLVFDENPEPVDLRHGAGMLRWVAPDGETLSVDPLVEVPPGSGVFYSTGYVPTMAGARAFFEMAPKDAD